MTLIPIFTSGKNWLLKNALLYDTFTTDDAAPITSPRTCEPGPGLLVVVDTGNKLSISGKNLVGTAGAGWGDPGVWLARDNAGSPATQTMTVGDASFLRFTPGTINTLSRFGFDTDATGNLVAPYFLTLDAGGVLQTAAKSTSTYSTAETALLQARRSVTKGFYYIQDGKLLWADEGNKLTAAYIGFTPYNMPFTASEIALLPLADYNSAWGGDWTEVTDTETNPASATTFDCEADFHAKWSWTHEAGKTVNPRFRYTSSTNYIGVQDYNNTFSLYKFTGGSFTSLWSGAAMTDGVSYTADLVAEGSSLKLYLDGVLVATVTETDHQAVTSGVVVTDLATNDIVITTHPYPALGIATSRVVCPQVGDAATHEADCVVEMKNIAFPVPVMYEFFRASGTDYLRLKLLNDGSLQLQIYDDGVFQSSLFVAVAGSISEGDDLVLVLDGANSQLFINGVSAGSSSSTPYATQTGFTAGTVIFDHIAFFPRDVSGLLPKGTF